MISAKHTDTIDLIMIQHEITIVEESNIVSIDQLKKNSNVVKVLKFPHNRPRKKSYQL